MHVQILLSTYNGQKYIDDQIKSILNQSYEDISILIRDDGSTDNTTKIISKYKNEKIKIIYGKNIGIVKSYFELINNSDKNAKYIAFSDQDDIWLNDKIERAVNLLNKSDPTLPCMYCSRLKIVDENLDDIGLSHQLPPTQPQFVNSLVSNVATGCTVVINNALRNKLINNVPNKIHMHDWWIYQVASAFGKVVIDNEYKILYRQHKNAVGMKSGKIKRWINRIKRLNSTKYSLITQQAKQIFDIYQNDLDLNKKKIISDFINRNNNTFTKVRYILFGKVRPISRIDNIIFRILMLLNKV